MRNAIERTVLAVMLILALTADSHAESQPKYRAIYITKPISTVTVDRPTAPTLAREEPAEQSGIPLPPDLASVLTAACEAEGVPLDIALAVMEHESGFDPDAVGPDGHDIGLFQIRRSNHSWLTEETGADPLTPEGNIVCGVWFLSYLYDYCGESWPAALTCWRWGPGHGETSEYASAVLAGAEKWEVKLDGR